MSPIDKQLIVRKAKLIEEDLEKLEEFKDINLDEYVRSLETRLQVERLLERIVGRVIDINYHILKEDFGVIPRDYYKSFILMGEKSVVDKELSEKVAESAGLRNALAHEYDKIDDTLVHASIKESLNQIPQYLEIVLDKYGNNGIS